jgi:prepilin-type N-terminal cleavage/methylation domain-containing protein
MIREKQSFTLVEILVVIVIIGILSSFIFFTINDSVEKASIAKSKMFSESIRNNLLLNLVSEWKFDDSTNLGLDSWGSNNGTNNGATAITDENQCVSEGCASFDGTDDYVDLGTIAISNPLQLNGGGTICAWIKPIDSAGRDNYMRMVDKSNGTQGQNGYAFYVNTDRDISVQINGGGAVESSGTVNDDEWSFVCVILNGVNSKFYINGELDSNISLASIPSAETGMRIGTWYSLAEREFKGSIDEVQIYNAVISESEIRENYLSGLTNLYSKGLISLEEYTNQIALID